MKLTMKTCNVLDETMIHEKEFVIFVINADFFQLNAFNKFIP